jgi:hypothetical protein
VSFAECVREEDVIDAVASGRWPDGVADLRDHVRTCRICADLVTIIAPLLDARDSAWEETRVPSSAVVWWRAQMRARREAARHVNRPLTIAQGMGVLTALAVLLAVGWFVAPWLDSSLSRAGALLAVDLSRVTLPDLSELGRRWWVALFLIVPWLILAPMAIYFAMTED